MDDALVRLILVRGLLPRLRDAPGGAGLALFDAVTSRLTRGPDAAATTILFAVGSLAAARMYADAGHLAMEVARMHPALRSGDAVVATLERFLRAGARREAAAAAREEKRRMKTATAKSRRRRSWLARCARGAKRVRGWSRGPPRGFEMSAVSETDARRRRKEWSARRRAEGGRESGTSPEKFPWNQNFFSKQRVESAISEVTVFPGSGHLSSRYIPRPAPPRGRLRRAGRSSWRDIFATRV